MTEWSADVLWWKWVDCKGYGNFYEICKCFVFEISTKISLNEKIWYAKLLIKSQQQKHWTQFGKFAKYLTDTIVFR